MKITKIALTCLCSTLLFCGCTKNSEVVIQINDTAITRGEYFGELNKIQKIQKENLPKGMETNAYAELLIKEKYTRDLIAKTLFSQEFEKRKIEATPEEIEAKKQKIIKELGSEDKLKEILKQHKVSNERFQKDLVSEVKFAKLINAETNADKISDSEVEKYYKQNKAQFMTPERARVSHILISFNPDDIKRSIVEADKEAKLTTANIEGKVKEQIAKKEALVKQLQKEVNPKNFAELAKKHSEDTGSAQNGGDLGYITREQVVKEFGDAAFTQKVGVVGPVVKSQYGAHLILVTDRAAKGYQKFEDVKNDLKTYLMMEKQGAGSAKLLNSLKDKADIKFLDESLNPENIRKEIRELLIKQSEEAKKPTQEIDKK